MAPALKLLIGLLFIAPAAAEPIATETILWVHSDVQGAPINTQLPQLGWGGAPNLGLLMASNTCAPWPFAPMQDLQAQLIAGPVQYDIDEGGSPRVAGPYDGDGQIVWDGTAAPTFTLSMTADTREPVTQDSVPLVIPDVVVYAELHDGEQTIAVGQTTPATLSPLIDHPEYRYDAVGGRHVYTATVPMDWVDAAPSQGPLYLSAGARINAPCEGETRTSLIELYHGPGFWPHLHVVTFDEIRRAGHAALAVGDNLIVRAGATTSWGWYDIAGDRYDIGTYPSAVVTGPDGKMAMARVNWPWKAILPFQLNGDNTWELPADLLEPKTEYTIELTFHNDQGALTNTTQVTFRTEGPDVTPSDEETCTVINGGPSCFTDEEPRPVKEPASLWWLLLLLLPFAAFMALWQSPGSKR